jgi:photosystem II stability/assembly factor-like uncharacterized protein
MERSIPKILRQLILFLLFLFALSCDRQDKIIEKLPIDPYLEGWDIRTKDLNIDVHPTSLLFLTPSEGFIIGYNGAIFHSTDSGNTWLSQNSGTSLHLNSIFFLNENTGFISGRGMGGCLGTDCNKGSMLLRTTDGGNHWTKMFYDSLAYLESMQFRHENNGIAIMENYRRPNSKFKFLVYTNNGGNNWTRTNINIPQTSPIEIIKTDDVYYLVGENNSLLKSDDYGQTWQSLSTPIGNSNDLCDIYFLNKNFGFISDHRKAYRTSNGGQSWEQINDYLVSFEGIHFYNENEGFNFNSVYVYDGGDFPSFKGTFIYSTKDGGLTFNISKLFPEFYLGITSFPAPNLGYAINRSKIHRFLKK